MGDETNLVWFCFGQFDGPNQFFKIEKSETETEPILKWYGLVRDASFQPGISIELRHLGQD